MTAQPASPPSAALPAPDRFPGLPTSAVGIGDFVRKVGMFSGHLNGRAQAAMVDALCAARHPVPEWERPTPWTALRADGEGLTIMDGQVVVGVIRPSALDPAGERVLALAPRMLGLLQELYSGPCGPNVWSRVAALIDASHGVGDLG